MRDDPNNYQFGCPVKDCGGRMMPRTFGWHCDKCSHYDLDMKRAPSTMSDCECHYCKTTP